MSNDKNINENVDAKSEEKDIRQQERDKTRDEAMHKHGLMLKGKADGLIIETNAAEGEGSSNPNSEENKKKKERDAEFYRHVLNEQAEYWQGQVDKFNTQIDATDKLIGRIKNGKYDSNSEIDQLLLQQSGLDAGYIEQYGAEGARDHKEGLIRKRNEAQENLEAVQDLEAKRKAEPNNPNIHAEIKNLNKNKGLSYDNYKNTSSKINLIDSAKSQDDVEKIAKILGEDKSDTEAIVEAYSASESENDTFFNASTVSAASLLDKENGVEKNGITNTFNETATGSGTPSSELENSVQISTENQLAGFGLS